MDQKLPIAEPGKKPRRRWYQFRLRTMLALVTLVACGIGWLALKIQEGRRQHADVAALEKFGGRMLYYYQFDAEDNRLPNAVLPGPAWLHAVLGDDFFSNVFSADFQSAECRLVNDACLEHVGRLVHLKALALPNTRVTDAGLEDLKGLNELRWLYLNGTQVTDAGVAKLQQALPGCVISR